MHERCRCPVDAFQHMISGKYKLRLIWDLPGADLLRYGELKKNLAALVPGSKEITARVLSRELKALAANGLIERTDHGTVPPKVEYALSPLGRSLIPVINTMQLWGMEHLIEVPAGYDRHRCSGGCLSASTDCGRGKRVRDGMLKQLAIVAFVAAAAIAPALAQTAPGDTGIAPNDTGRGVERGLTAVNSSAQTGMLTILRGSGSPRLQITVDGSRGHAESVTLVRGRTCPEALSAPNVAVLGTLHDGHLSATSPIAFDHLMSGNYSVLVRNNTADSRPVVCGHIYLN